MIYVLALVTFYYTDGIHEAGSICQVREEDFDARFMKKLKSPWENIYSKTEIDEMMNAKQDLLIEGTGIDIDEDDEISCTVEPSTVTVTQVQTTGTKIATIDVDGVDTDIYAPAASGGLDEDVIADEFDTTPIIIPGQSYAKYDIIKKDSHYYWAKQATSAYWIASEWTDAGTSITDVAPSGTWDQVQIAGGAIVHDTNISKYVINTDQWSQGWSEGIGEQGACKYGNYKGDYQGGTSTYHQYSAGDFCMHEGGLYKCNGSTTGQSWVAAKWDATQVTDELGGGGSSGGATVIEVWVPPTEPGAQYRILDSFADAKSRHLTVDFKVGSATKTLSEVKALVEAGYCVLKTSKELSPIITVETMHSFVLVKGYGTDYDDSFIFTYGGGVWTCM